MIYVMKKQYLLSVVFSMLLILVFAKLTCAEITSDSKCLLTATNNKTLLAGLARDFDKDSSTVIIEFTIVFNNDFDYAEKAPKNYFQPTKWYRTQGKYSSQLLLSYEIYYGLLKNLLCFSIKEITIHLSVSPPGCFHDMDFEEIEELISNFLLKDFRIDGNALQHSFTYSEDVEICTARLGEADSWGALIYKCCGYDSVSHKYCDDVEANRWMLALIIFIIVITSLVALYILRVTLKPHIEENFFYRPKAGDVLEFTIKVEKEREKCSRCSCSADDIPSLSKEKLEKMKEFYNSIENKLTENVSLKIGVKEVSFTISSRKIILENKRTINVFRNIFDFFFYFEQNDVINSWCDKCTCVLGNIFRLLFMVALASPSFPLAYALCTEDIWYRKVANANSKNGPETYLYIPWRLTHKAGKVVFPLVYVFYSSYIVLQVFFENKWHKDIRDSRKKVNLYTQFSLCLKKIVSIQKFSNCHCCKEKALWVLKTVLISLFIVMFLSTVSIFIIGINFVLHVAVMIITILVVQSSLLYDIIPIILLLIFYFWDSFNQVQNPFNEFMKALVLTDFFKTFNTDGYVVSHQNNYPDNVEDDESFCCCRKKSNLETQEQEKTKLLQIQKGKVLFKVKEPFIYSNEFKVSKKFFFHCATVDYSGAPGSLKHNYKKASFSFFKFALFVLFVFFVMMAFGRISYISPSSRTFLTFFAGLLPHILNKFSKGYKPFTRDICREERFQQKLKEKLESFQEQWEVKDIYIDTIHDVDEGNTQSKIDLKIVFPVVTRDVSKFELLKRKIKGCFKCRVIENSRAGSHMDFEEHGIWYRKRRTGVPPPTLVTT